MPRQSLAVLVVMSVTSKDTDTPPVYFAGWDHLAMSLGYLTDPAAPSARRAVGRALVDLESRGLVKRTTEWRYGHRVYVLTLPLSD
jgi:hypothetical protein